MAVVLCWCGSVGGDGRGGSRGSGTVDVMVVMLSWLPIIRSWRACVPDGGRLVWKRRCPGGGTLLLVLYRDGERSCDLGYRLGTCGRYLWMATYRRRVLLNLTQHSQPASQPQARPAPTATQHITTQQKLVVLQPCSFCFSFSPSPSFCLCLCLMMCMVTIPAVCHASVSSPPQFIHHSSDQSTHPPPHWPHSTLASSLATAAHVLPSHAAHSPFLAWMVRAHPTRRRCRQVNDMSQRRGSPQSRLPPSAPALDRFHLCAFP
ncbi:hypothetical protein J1614_009504 [Plenodomus biglobosus]|nr:hypothetical protein J1614_009504 [Plenodomus biglobosus]